MYALGGIGHREAVQKERFGQGHVLVAKVHALLGQ